MTTTLTDEALSTVPSYRDRVNRYHFPEPPLELRVTEDVPRAEHDVLVYDVLYAQYHEDTPATQTQKDALVGRVARLRPAVNRERGWFHALSDHGRFYVLGTRLNPDPQIGHFYRVVNGGQFLVQYEAVDRWLVVRGAGHQPWMMNDHLVNAPTCYYEVANPDASDLDGLEVTDIRDNSEDEEAEVVAPLDTARFHDRAEVNSDGNAERVVEFQDGQFYVGYSTEPRQENTVYYGVKVAGRDDLVHWGSWSNRWGGEVDLPEFTGFPANMQWAKALITPPIRAAFPDSVETVQAALTSENTRWEEFNDALNELAQTEGWCSEYERIMGELGMRSRRAQRIRLSVDVDVSLTVTVDSPAYRITSAIDHEHGVSDIENLRFDAKVNVPVEFVIDRDNDYDDGYDEDMDPSDYITNDMVQDAVEGRMTDCDWTVEDWTVDGTVEESSDQENL